MIPIKFSHKYKKMLPGIADGFFTTRLVGVIPCWKNDLSTEFIDWDTAYEDGNYKLPEGRLILLLLLTGGRLWTTIRRWKPALGKEQNKEEYYTKHLGEQVEIRIEEEQHGNTST